MDDLNELQITKKKKITKKKGNRAAMTVCRMQEQKLGERWCPGILDIETG